MVILIIFSSFFVGFLIGRITVKKYDGMFIINDSNMETTKWILDVKTDPIEISNKKEVKLKVHKMTEGDV